jgi:fructokinase
MTCVGVGELLWDDLPGGRRAGGAALNFAFHCRELGADGVVVSRVGDDADGHALRAEVRRLGLSDAFIQTDPTRPTGTVSVTLADGVPAYRIAEGVAWGHLEWTPTLERLAEAADAVCFGTLPLRHPVARRTVLTFAEENRKAILPSVRVLDLNLRTPRPEKAVLADALSAAEWVKATEDELTEVAHQFGLNEPELIDMHREADAGHEAAWFVTAGPNGGRVVTPGGAWAEPGVPAAVVDTVGAGDAFTAAMVVMRLKDHPWADCLRFAVRYAAAVCEHPGPTPVIDSRLRDDPPVG